MITLRALIFLLVPAAVLAQSYLNGSITTTGGVSTLSIKGQHLPFPAATFSALNGVINQYFQALPPPINSTLVNSTHLSYLTLDGGAWVADEPFTPPSFFILVLQGGVTVTPTPTFPPYRAMIEVNNTENAGVVVPSGPYSAESGATFTCSDSAVSPGVVWGVDAPKIYVDGLRIFGCGRTHGGSVHIQGTPGFWGWTVAGAVVTNCDISNATRAIWTESVSSVSVHNNTLYNCSSHTLDFDAFSHYSTATSNTIFGNAGREGVFIEQAAVGITVAGNTIGPGNGNGVAVFNNDMNITTGPHVIAGNDIFGNLNAGIALGSTAPRSGLPNVGVMVQGNRLWGNGEKRAQGLHINGAQIGTWWACNDNMDGVSAFTLSKTFTVSFFGGFGGRGQGGVVFLVPALILTRTRALAHTLFFFFFFQSNNISIFDPLDREKALSY